MIDTSRNDDVAMNAAIDRERSPMEIGLGWVWISSQLSVSRGQKSVLATIEIPIAFLAWWWIVINTAVPWMSLVALMSVPLLLMASPSAIADGRHIVEKSRIVIEDLGVHLLSWAFSFVLLLAAGFFALLVYAYYPAMTKIPAYLDHEFKFLIVGLPLAFVCVVSSIGLAFCYLKGFFHSMYVLTIVYGVSSLLLMIFGFFWIVFYVIVLLPDGGVQTLIFSFSILQLISGVGSFSTILIEPLMSFIGRAIGRDIPLGNPISKFISWVPLAFLVILFVRIYSNSRNILSGIKCFPSNVFQIMLCVDIFHPPEMIPGVQTVVPQLGLSHWLERDSWVLRDGVVSLLTENAWRILLVVFIYIPAILYRFNIKAAVWLWGGVAWTLSSKRWANFEDMRVGVGYWIDWAASRTFLLLVFWSAAWMLRDWWPTDVQSWLFNMLPSSAAFFLSNWPAIDSIRGFFGFVLCVGLALLWFQSNRTYKLHKKAWESASDYSGKGDLQLSMTKSVEWVYLFLRIDILISIFLIWSWAAWFAAVGPLKEKFGSSVWPFLVQWL